mgnify:CR=1 FL=1
MPTIPVTVPKSAWSVAAKAEMAATLTDSLAEVAKNDGQGDIKQYINVHIEETAEGGYAMGGNVVG